MMEALHYLLPTSLTGVILLGTTLLFLSLLLSSLYNLHLHPLRSFPGPLLHRASLFPYLYHQLTGRLPYTVHTLHRQYGPIVRISPNSLSFSDPQAWKDIYGHRAHGEEEFAKPRVFYRLKTIPPSLLSETRENHSTLRRLMAHGFSERSMRAQEGLIGGYVDELVRGLKRHCFGAPGQQEGEEGKEEGGKEGKKKVAQNMVAWYNWTTFDVIGDLAFGEPFGCLEKAEYDPWVDAIGKSIRFGSVLLAIRLLGLEDWVMPVLRRLSDRSRRFHLRRTMDKLERRVNLKMERPDFLEGLLRKREEWGMDMQRLAANASLLIVAGSETTATLLSGATYLLLKHPEAMKKLTEEVRSTFKSDEEITLSSVNSLEYMLACLNEAMRHYPPVPIGMPRVVPKGGAKVAGTFVPQGTVVAVWQWATNHNEQHFTKPFEYHPERWMHDPQFAGDRLDAVQPFVIGPRNCLGKNLAYAEMRLILAKVIYNFDMQLADPSKDWLDQQIFTLWDKHPLPVYLTPVQRNGV
ncbi:cytochrome P450 [Sordaria brevicollis]|uniref:Cytochrome P450 n=1 Tax=Sordaria brevicollis TaxID=83679 RepID=A0AAE0NW24_SORBR|nr:cytochrome P450 [Sordaria brevicollis]